MDVVVPKILAHEPLIKRFAQSLRPGKKVPDAVPFLLYIRHCPVLATDKVASSPVGTGGNLYRYGEYYILCARINLNKSLTLSDNPSGF